MNVFDIIDNNLSNMTKGQKRIAHYILENRNEILYIPAIELGKKVNASESTVNRFTKLLGFDGYKSFQNAVKNSILGTLDIMELFNEVMSDRSNETHNYLYAVKSEIQNIYDTFKNIEESTLNTIVDMILNARRVGILGHRGSTAPALIFNMFLNQLLGKAILLNDISQTSYDCINKWDNQDLIIAFDFSVKESETSRILKFAKENGCKIISVTMDTAEPIISVSDIFIKVETHSAYVSYTSSIVLVNVLLFLLNKSVPKKDLYESYKSTERIISYVLN